MRTNGGNEKTHSRALPVLLPNLRRSNPDATATRPRLVQSTGIDGHELQGAPRGQAVPRATRAPQDSPFSREPGEYNSHHFLFSSRSFVNFHPHESIVALPPSFVRSIATIDHSPPPKIHPLRHRPAEHRRKWTSTSPLLMV